MSRGGINVDCVDTSRPGTTEQGKVGTQPTLCLVCVQKVVVDTRMMTRVWVFTSVPSSHDGITCRTEVIINQFLI